MNNINIIICLTIDLIIFWIEILIKIIMKTKYLMKLIFLKSFSIKSKKQISSHILNILKIHNIQ